MTSKLTYFTVGLVTLCLLSSFAIPFVFASGLTTKTSFQSAGYVVVGPAGSASSVKASWTVPTVTCTSTNTQSNVSVGIDALTGTDAVEIGTSSNCSGGAPSYSIWYQEFPLSRINKITPLITVSPGDHILATISFTTTSARFHLLLKDETTSASFKATLTLKTYLLEQITFLVGDSSVSGVIQPLANFGTASFGKQYTSVGATCVATLSGTTAPIGAFASVSGFTLEQITMVDSSMATMATTSALSSTGGSFQVTWVASS